MNSARMRASLIAPLLILSAACTTPESKQLRPPGIGPNRGAPAVQPAPTPSVEQRPAEPTTYDFERAVPSDPGALAAQRQPAPTAATQPTPTAGPARRDLANELSTALAGLNSCVDVAKAAQQPDGKLTISVTAMVLASGALGRPEVSAAGQPETALRCLNQQVGNLRLAPDVPDAPQRVSASTTVQVKAVGNPANPAQPAGAAPAIPPAPTNPDVARPEPTDLAKPDSPDLAGPP